MNNQYSHLSPSVAQALYLYEQMTREFNAKNDAHTTELIKDQMSRGTSVTQQVTHVISKLHSNWHVVATIASGISFAKIGFAALNVIVVPILVLIETLKRRQLYKNTGNPNDAVIPAENKSNYLQNFLISSVLFSLVIPMLLLPAIAPILAIVSGVIGLIAGAVGLVSHAVQVKKSRQYIADRLSNYKNSNPQLGNVGFEQLKKNYQSSLNIRIDENATQIQYTKNKLVHSLREDEQGNNKTSLTLANQLNQLISEKRVLQTKKETFAKHEDTLQYAGYTRMRMSVILGLGALVFAGAALALFPPFAIAAIVGFTIVGVATVATIGFVATASRLKTWWTQRFIPSQTLAPDVENNALSKPIARVKTRDPMQFAKDEYFAKLNRLNNAVILKEHYASLHLVELLLEINKHIEKNRLPNNLIQEAIEDEPSLQRSINTAWHEVYPNPSEEKYAKLIQQFQYVLNVLPKRALNIKDKKNDDEGEGDGKQPVRIAEKSFH